MRLRKHIIQSLNEKVSKVEIDEALNNPNITIGIELEFLVDELGEYVDQDAIDNYDSAHSAYEEFYDDFRRFERDRDRINDDISRVNDKIDKLETVYTELDETIGDDEDENENIVKKMEKLQDRIDQYKEKLQDLENDVEQLEYPYPNGDYITYMENIGMLDNSWEDSAYEGNIPTPPDPREDGDMSLNTEEKWNEAVQERTHLWDTLPLPSYAISDTGYDNWNIKYDSSVEGGIELVSPLLTMKEFNEIVPKLFDWIDRNGGTDVNTGLHIHMGVKGVSDLESELDPIKMVMLVEEDYIWRFFDERKVNIYTKSMSPKLISRGISNDEIKTLVDTNKLKKDMSENHFDAINFQSWNEGHVEFRHMGGSNYHKKWKEVRLVTARNAHALSAGCDPNYKRQEYLTKLSRMSNKFDMLRWVYTRDRMKTFLQLHPSLLEKYLKMEYIKVVNFIGSTFTKEVENVIKQTKIYDEFVDKYITQLCDTFKKRFPDYDAVGAEEQLLKRYSED